MTCVETDRPIGAPLFINADTPHNLSLLGIAVSPPLPVAQSHTTTIDMTDERVTVRVETSRVVRAVIRFFNTQFESRSTTGQLSIHESRVSARGGHEADDLDLEDASATEILDAIYRAGVRRAVYAPPARRLDVVHEDGVHKGQPLRCVAPRRMVAHVVNVKPTRHAGGGTSGVRLWRLEFVKCLGKIPRQCQAALKLAVEIAGKRIELGNQLQAARSDVERLRGSSKKKAAKLRADAANRLYALEAHDRESSRILDELVRSAAHRYGLRRLERIITASAEVERAIFPERF